MTFWREFSTPPLSTLSKGLGDSLLTPNPTGSVRESFAIKKVKNF